MKDNDSLREYREKRDFRKTGEPSGEEKKASEKPLFVIQKHDASRLHYDFRLEVGGVLKSWAVPKGPSTDSEVKRLAIPTEDHPLDYADFEGIIPEGSYGAGTVLVWDTGTYRNLRAEDVDRPVNMEQSYQGGKVLVYLEGQKLHGGYALIRTNMGGAKNWLLVKERDLQADPRRDPVSNDPNSVLSGKSLEEIAQQAINKGE